MGKDSGTIDLWNDVVRPSILEQYQGKTLSDEQVSQWDCNNRWQACLKSIVDKLQYLDNAACELPTYFDFSKDPVGKQLDWIVGLVNKKRKEGESDENLFSRFLAGLGRGRAGSAPVLIESAKRMSKDDNPVYLEEENGKAPVVFVYTPNGRQLTRGAVKSLTPAGVLGVPGAALKTATDKFLVVFKFEKFRLTDENGVTLTDDKGTPLIGSIGFKKRLICVAKDSNINQ